MAGRSRKNTQAAATVENVEPALTKIANKPTFKARKKQAASCPAARIEAWAPEIVTNPSSSYRSWTAAPKQRVCTRCGQPRRYHTRYSETSTDNDDLRVMPGNIQAGMAALVDTQGSLHQRLSKIENEQARVKSTVHQHTLHAVHTKRAVDNIQQTIDGALPDLTETVDDIQITAEANSTLIETAMQMIVLVMAQSVLLSH